MDEVIRAPAVAEVLTDDQAMALALSEARKGLGFVSPNPPVGCVILDTKNGFLAAGYHHRYGGPHAEVDAVTGLSPREMQNSKLFVTLEPCAHEGQTPSCAKMIAKLPFREVIYGMVDPNPLVAGQGIRILNEAKIETREYSGVFKQDILELCEHFLVNQIEKRPFISLKVATSLDGQLGLKTGESKWITGEEARNYGHQLRAIHDAILVGQKTLEIDDPSLDVRHQNFPGKQNKVIVLLSQQTIQLNPKLKIFSQHSKENVFLLRRSQSGYVRMILLNSGALMEDTQRFNLNLTPCLDFSLEQSADHPPEHSLEGRLDSSPGQAFEPLRKPAPSFKMPFSSVLIEGGAQVLSSFISNHLADRLYVFQAPILLGGKSGKSWSEDVIIAEMNNRIELKNFRLLRLGKDIMLTGRL